MEAMGLDTTIAPITQTNHHHMPANALNSMNLTSSIGWVTSSHGLRLFSTSWVD
jgi:hypothetical protein